MASETKSDTPSTSAATSAPTAPAAPRLLKRYKDSFQVEFDLTTGVTSYLVEYSASGLWYSWTPVPAEDVRGNAATIKGLREYTSYVCRVTAINSLGQAVGALSESILTLTAEEHAKLVQIEHVEKLEADVVRLREENKAFRGANNGISELQAHADRLVKTNGALKTQNESVERECRQLREQLRSMVPSSGSSTDEAGGPSREELERQLADLQVELENCEAKLDDQFQNQVKVQGQLQNAVTVLEAELAAEKKKAADVEERLASAATSSTESEETVGRLEAQIAALQESMQALEASMAAEADRRAAVEKELEEATAARKDAEEEAAAALRDAADTTKNLEDAEAKSASLQSKLDLMETQVQRTETALEEQSDARDAAEARANDLEKEVKAFEIKLQDAKALQAQVSAKADEVDDLQEASARLSAQIQALEARLEEASKRADEATLAGESDKGALEATIADLKTRLDAAESDAKTNGSLVETAIGERDAALARLDTLTEELEAAKAANTKLSAQKDEMLAATAEMRATMEAEVKAARDETAELRRSGVQTREEELKSVFDRVDQLDKELTTERQRSAELKASVEAVSASSEALNEELQRLAADNQRHKDAATTDLARIERLSEELRMEAQNRISTQERVAEMTIEKDRLTEDHRKEVGALTAELAATREAMTAERAQQGDRASVLEAELTSVREALASMTAQRDDVSGSNAELLSQVQLLEEDNHRLQRATKATTSAEFDDADLRSYFIRNGIEEAMVPELVTQFKNVRELGMPPLRVLEAILRFKDDQARVMDYLLSTA